MKSKSFLLRLGRIVSTAVTVILALLLCANLYTIVAKTVFHVRQPSVFGYSNAVVISGSMSGTIEVNDMVVIHRQNTYSRWDIISFRSEGQLVTHRIAEVTKDGFCTKGDANDSADPGIVRPEDVVGRVVWVIPGIGAVIAFLSTPLGMTCMVFLALLMLEWPILVKWLSKTERQEK